MRAVRFFVALLVPVVLGTAWVLPVESATPSPAPEPVAGPPGKWTKVTTGNVSLINEPGLYRTPDGVLHVVYERQVAAGDQIGHTAIKPSGVIKLQNNAIAAAWEHIVSDPKAVQRAGGGIRVIFGGGRTLSPGYWSDGRTYTALGNTAGSSWTLPAQAVGLSNQGYASYGTGATTVASGAPIASFPLNSTITWHVGTSETEPDHTYTLAGAALYNTTLTRDGNQVFLAFYASGPGAAKEGTFVKRIYPTLGPTVKAPNSSVGSSSLNPDQAVAMTTRKGGGVFMAYCVGYPTCDYMQLWKVGTNITRRVPHSAMGSDVAISKGPAGRLWIAWSEGTQIHAIRTGTTGLRFGGLRTIRVPKGTLSVYRLAIEGSSGRGDIFVNNGHGIFHQQVFPGLSLRATPTKWRQGVKKTVRFTVTDAAAPLAHARVKVGARSCFTNGLGKCAITFPKTLKPGRYRAEAQKAGYGKSFVFLRVRR